MEGNAALAHSTEDSMLVLNMLCSEKHAINDVSSKLHNDEKIKDDKQHAADGEPEVGIPQGSVWHPNPGIGIQYMTKCLAP